ncbi:hypothetical protein F4809DRAFT_266043 [Biscogniauxia mediterranea]|nr:hypothetical protein F4809DRAFT_266043 [Biscogniauxia mediterranea]
MRLTAITLLGVGASCVLGQAVRVEELSSTEDQIIRVDEPSSETIDVDGATVASGGVEVPEESEIALPGVKSTTAAQLPSQPSPPPQPEAEPVVPISAILFSGAPGPKDCRGSALMRVSLAKPGAQHAQPRCYNVPAGSVAQCALFTANQDDGCQARLFAEPDCLTFANLAVFTPEKKPMGGVVRSVEIRCGVVSEAPPPLKLPGMILPPGGAQQAFGKHGRLESLLSRYLLTYLPTCLSTHAEFSFWWSATPGYFIGNASRLDVMEG